MLNENTPAPAHASSGMKIPILFGAVLALLAANIYLYTQVDKLRGDVTKMRDSMLEEVAKVRETASLTTLTNRRRVDSLHEQLEVARRQAHQAAGQAKTDALKRAEEIREKLEVAQAQQKEQVKADLAKVEESANTKFGAVDSEVTSVKTDVAATKSELEKTVSDLKRTSGDLNVQSGLIATNGKELQALKALGERNYFEFHLSKSKQPEKVGDISVLLKRADTKKNRYTIEVIADDQRVEKKDRTVNEPLQFYTSKAKQPYEIVVNSVKKDQVSGYLATPKVQTVRN